MIYLPFFVYYKDILGYNVVGNVLIKEKENDKTYINWNCGYNRTCSFVTNRPYRLFNGY